MIEEYIIVGVGIMEGVFYKVKVVNEIGIDYFLDLIEGGNLIGGINYFGVSMEMGYLMGGIDYLGVLVEGGYFIGGMDYFGVDFGFFKFILGYGIIGYLVEEKFNNG